MSSHVFNTVNLIIGGRGTGKTVYVVGDPKENLGAVIAPIYLKKEMKVLIIDTFNHPAYNHIKIIQPQQINNHWKKGIYRTYVNMKEMDALLDHVSNNFWNGAIIFEDAYKHQKNKISNACAAMIGDSKNKNVDLHFMFHDWAFVPLDLIRYLDYVEHFKTKTPPGEREAKKFGAKFENVLTAFNHVNQHPSRFYHESANTEQ